MQSDKYGRAYEEILKYFAIYEEAVSHVWKFDFLFSLCSVHLYDTTRLTICFSPPPPQPGGPALQEGEAQGDGGHEGGEGEAARGGGEVRVFLLFKIKGRVSQDCERK